MAQAVDSVPPIEHPGEEQSNDLRRRMQSIEPLCLRTYTPSLAVSSSAELARLSKSALRFPVNMAVHQNRNY